MTTTFALLEEQNRLLQQQNDLLKEIRFAQQRACETAPSDPNVPHRLMTEHDLVLVLMTDNILQAIDRWHKTAEQR